VQRVVLIINLIIHVSVRSKGKNSDIIVVTAETRLTIPNQPPIPLGEGPELGRG
jgi:hypothetical protein